ncbi:MAG: hypothetical protein R6U44_09990 [Archaeoglobaceae archaeon]
MRAKVYLVCLLLALPLLGCSQQEEPKPTPTPTIMSSPVTLDNQSNDYFATYGNISSEYKIEEGQSWLNKLDRLGDNIRENNSLSPYFYPNGPIISYGHDRQGYFVVGIDKNSTPSKNTLDNVCGIIDDEAQKMEIHEVPVAFRYTSIPKEH